jgi:hypothetical protein
MKVVSGREYPCRGGWVRFQAILAGGGAVLSAQTSSASEMSTVATLAEGFLDVNLPESGKFKVVLTGSAAVTL